MANESDERPDTPEQGTSVTDKYAGVTLQTRGNVFAEGRCVSHEFTTADGVRKSVVVVLASAVLRSDKPQVIECVEGVAQVGVSGERKPSPCGPGEFVSVPAGGRVEIVPDEAPFHYICHYG